MSAFRYGDCVVVLCQNLHGAFYDVPGIYQRLITAGTSKGKHAVAFNGVTLHVSADRLAPSADYFHAYNNDRSKLPGGSTGRLHSVEYIESDGGIRGQLLPEILKREPKKDE